MTSPPGRTGLALGPAMNQARAQLRAQITAGTIDPGDILTGSNPDAEAIALGMRVDKIISATPGVGDDAAASILHAARVPGHKRLGQLPIQSRCAIAAQLQQAYPRTSAQST